MGRSIFGWDYPPGVSSLPWDVDYPCSICGEFEDECICPECPECDSVGDPYCYIHHGMRRTEEQKFSLECKQRSWEVQNRAYWKAEKEAEEYDNWADELSGA